MFAHESWGKSRDSGGGGIDLQRSSESLGFRETAQCQPAAPGKVDRTDEAAFLPQTNGEPSWLD